MDNKPITIYGTEGIIRVSRVKGGIAYDQENNPIDSNRFGNNARYVLCCDGEYPTDGQPTVSHEEMMRARSKALDAIKNNPKQWELFKKYNYGV